MRAFTHLNKDDFFVYLRTTKHSGQHQVLRCSGILTEIKTKNNQLGKAVTGTKMKRQGKMACEPEFVITVAKFPWFYFLLTKIPKRRRKLKVKVTTKENSLRVVHWKFAKERELYEGGYPV